MLMLLQVMSEILQKLNDLPDILTRFGESLDRRFGVFFRLCIDFGVEDLAHCVCPCVR